LAEAKDTSSAPPSAAGKRTGAGFELRLERGGAYVRLVDQILAPGVRLETLTLQLPDVKFPFDVGQGAGQFRHRLGNLADLSVAIEPSAADEVIAAAGLAAFGIEEPRIAAREGFIEIAGRLSGGPPFTLEAGLLPAGDHGVSLVFHSPRVLGPAPVPAAALPHLARAVLDAVGRDAVPLEPVAPLLRRLLAPRGWKLPRLADARLARAAIADGAARLVWDRAAAGPAATAADPEVLAADEGARTFRDAEALLARGDWNAAREAYLAGHDAGHPFAAERLLALLAHDERFHEEALDLAAEWLARRPGFGAALAAEASVRLARGEEGRAARAFAALAASAAERGRTFLALAAAEAGFALPGAAREDGLLAVEIALGIRRDHIPALRALRALARAGGDREALLRANRRLVAYDPEPASKARAHAELGELLLVADPPGARLHLDHALRLAPDDAEALAALSRACAAAGEPLRAVRALDRLKDLLLARGERARAASVALEAGELWEGPLGHPENALLRYRDAAELAPSADAHARAARAAEKAGQWTEAADHHAAALAALDRTDPGAAALASRTHVALADVSERLGDPAATAAHLEKAAALAPDASLLRRIVALHRARGPSSELLAALDRLAAAEPDVAARAAVLAEAAEAALAQGLAGDARARFTAAVAAHPTCKPALSGLAQIARERGDALAERDALERLLPLSPRGAEAAAVLDRIADARERAGDLRGALEAAAEARRVAPAPARLETSLRLARRAGGPAALAPLLAEWARAAAESGDAVLAADAWLERARLLAAASPAEALAALAEASAVSPGHPAVLRAQAELAERTGDYRLALGCVRALLGRAPEDAALLELRAARAALGAGEAQAAKDHAERAFACGVPGAAEVLDEILERAGDDGARADVLARLGRHLDAARLFERHGDTARARAALERAALDQATAAQALPRLADLRLGEGDRPGAAAALLALALLGEGREAARLALRAHVTGRDPAPLDVAIEKDPRFAPARARRAALRASDDPASALEDAEAALAGEDLPADERAGVLALAARAAAAKGDGPAARRHLSAYCDLVPDDDAALARLAALHRAAGAADDLATVLARRLPRAAAADAAQVRLELSDLLAARDPARAARLALEALERAPTSAAALRAVTTPPRAAHVPAAARAALLARLAGDASATPEEAAAALGARARLLADSGDANGALAALRDAARRGPEPDDLLELRARLAAAAGERVEAARALLERARRARDHAEPAAAERLADAGLHALAAGVEGAEEALRAALALGPERETRRAVLEALVRCARERGDADAEREALPLLVPLLPTGARPAALLRVSALAAEAKNPILARASAEEARALAPHDLAAVEACRAAALAEGDLAAVAALLADAALLDPASAGARHLDRARLLVALRRHEEADDAYRAARAVLPPNRALADEQVRLRRDALPSRPAQEPMEAFALRTTDSAEAASALRAAAAVALQAGDLPAALRCARRAHARAQDDPAFAGALLSRVLYVMGSRGEALVLHRRLLEAGFPGVAPEDAVALCRQAADLAEDAGERDLALRAVDELLRLRPQEIEAALLRFDLEPDRARAVRDLAEATAACGSQRGRVLALARAAEGALEDGRDRDLADRLFLRARQEAERSPALALAVARRRAEAIRHAEGASAPAFLEAIHEAAAAAQVAGDRGVARDLLEEAIARERERGLFGEAARDLLELDVLAVADGDFAESAARLRAAGALQREAGDLASATETLRRAYATNPESDETFARLEDVLRARGAETIPLLLELLGDRVARAAAGPRRAAALVRLADVHRAAQDIPAAEAALRAALADVPGHADAEDRLLALLADSRRTVERARLLLERAARLPEVDARVDLRREAAAALGASTVPEDRDLAAEVWRTVAAARPADLEAARAVAGLLVGLGRREDAIPHLAALVEADPDDDAAAGELARAYEARPVDLADLLVTRAARVSGEARAARLRQAASALFSAGEDARARAALRDAFEAWPGDGAAFAQALRDATSDPDRIDAVLSARARAVPAEAASCHRTRADVLQATGRMDDAIAAYEAALAADPGDLTTLGTLAACLAEARGDAAAATLDRRMVALAEEAPGTVPGAAEAPSRFRVGLALSFAGKMRECVPHLERAVYLAPFDGHAGLAWAALAEGYAIRGDTASALAAARARIERAIALGLEEEKRAALEADAELAARLGLPSAVGPAAVEISPPGAEAIAEEPFAFGFETEPEPEPERAEPPPGEEPFAFGFETEPEPERAEPPPGEESFAFGSGTEPEESPPGEEPFAFGSESETEQAESPPAEEPFTFGPEPEQAESPPAEEPFTFGSEPEPEQAEPPPAEEAFAFGSEPEPESEPAEPPPAKEPFAFARDAEGEPPADAEPPRSVEDWILSTDALELAGAAPDEVRATLEKACEAHPDSPQPWRALARLEAGLGDPLATARAQLAASIRGEGDLAARAALEAARLFEEGDQHADAARAYRAAMIARPGAVPDAVLLAAEALATGEPEAAVRNLSALSPSDLPDETRGAHARKLARALDAAGLAEEAERAWAEILAAAPADAEAFARGSALALARAGVGAWLDVAALHEEGLAASGDSERRRELRLERARQLAQENRLEAARAALLAALELDPADPAVHDALTALDAYHDGWAASAAALGEEAAQAVDGAEGAALYLRAGRILHDRVHDPVGADAALRSALARARSSNGPAARRTADEAEALLQDLGSPPAAEPAQPEPAPEQPPGEPSGLAAEGAAASSAPEEPFAFAPTPEEPHAAEGAPSQEDAPAPWLESPEPGPAALEAAIASAPALAAGSPEAPDAIERPAAADPQELAREGRALMEEGNLQGAYDRLSLALSGEPSDVTVARDLSRIAEKLGLFDEYVQLGEVCADAIAAYDPLAAAARYRHFAEVVRDRLAAPERAEVMLEKALSLVPDDADTRRALLAHWAERPETAPRALEGWLDLARRDPSDATALAGAAAACERLAAAGGEAAPRLLERARLAASIAAFVSRTHPAPAPGVLAGEIPPDLRARVAAPGAVGPLARLLRTLAPWLETLFPADLSRRGVSAEDRLDPARTPAIAAAFEGASRALRARPFATFLSNRPGIDSALENTRPPSIVLGAGIAVLDDLALSFLAARTLDLLEHGWALVGKFAPKDVGILLELACRFAGGAPPSMGLPPERAGAFFAVLESQVPGTVRAAAGELGAAAAQELAESDPRTLAAALRRTANRVALLHAGDPGAALRVLALLDRRLDAETLDPAQALTLPDLRDLALFALSDPFLELRAAVLGYISEP